MKQPTRTTATHPTQGTLDTFATQLANVGHAVAEELLPKSATGKARLAESVTQLSHAYTRARHTLEAVQESPEGLAARLCFFLPRDAPKIFGPLAELHQQNLVPERDALQLLDIGAGVGATSLGAARFFAATGRRTTVHIDAVDRSRRALEAFHRLLTQQTALGLLPTTLRTHVANLEREMLPFSDTHYDLIVMGLVLNELSSTTAEHGERLICEALRRLRPDGALIILEPALRHTSRQLQMLRDRLVLHPSLTVWAPCPTGGPCPLLASPKDWCHENVAGDLPERIMPIAQAAGLRSARRTYSYLTLRPGQVRRCADGLVHAPSHKGHGNAEPERPSDIFRVVSDPLLSKGKHQLALCGRHGRTLVTRLDRHRSPHNRPLDDAVRGDFVTIATPAGLAVEEPTTPAADTRIFLETSLVRLSSRAIA